MGVNGAIHRPPECLMRLHAAVKEPAPRTSLLHLGIGRLSTPRNVPPSNGLVEGSRRPDRACVNAIVEEHDKSCTPIAPNCKWLSPTSWPAHLVSREVEGVDLRLGEKMTTGNVTLRTRLGKAWERVDQVLVPSPSEDGPQVPTSCKIKSRHRLQTRMATGFELGVSAPESDGQSVTHPRQ